MELSGLHQSKGERCDGDDGDGLSGQESCEVARAITATVVDQKCVTSYSRTISKKRDPSLGNWCGAGESAVAERGPRARRRALHYRNIPRITLLESDNLVSCPYP